ncbi:hypothetical protein CRT38_05797 [Anaplasma phagocytophilum str. CRT38]|uniref:Uncharacterized protein n=1 Tax=Anaplasma phagocytophilum str. CRT38 TaxID=1269275 RepID=S6G8N9_ANAPH|nr:hypothetical protein CRT38_05797 [Anaplasma phagocytophilum str. CRT38]
MEWLAFLRASCTALSCLQLISAQLRQNYEFAAGHCTSEQEDVIPISSGFNCVLFLATSNKNYLLEATSPIHQVPIY